MPACFSGRGWRRSRPAGAAPPWSSPTPPARPRRRSPCFQDRAVPRCAPRLPAHLPRRGAGSPPPRETRAPLEARHRARSAEAASRVYEGIVASRTRPRRTEHETHGAGERLPLAALRVELLSAEPREAIVARPFSQIRLLPRRLDEAARFQAV